MPYFYPMVAKKWIYFSMSLLALLLVISFLSESPAHSDDDLNAVPSRQKETGNAFLGVALRNVSEKDPSGLTRKPESKGLVQVRYIFPGTPADRSKLCRGDIIAAINGESFDSKDPLSDFIRIIQKHMPGDSITIEGMAMRHEIWCDGKALDIEQYGDIPLDNIYYQNGKLTDSTIEKKLIVKPFKYRIILGKRNHRLRRRSLPRTLQIESDSKLSFGLGALVQSKHKFFFRNIEKIDEIIRKRAFEDIYGTVQLETRLHLNPSNISDISDEVSQVFNNANECTICKAKVLLDGNSQLTSPLPPPLPQTRKEGLQQLIDVIHTKHEMEREFFLDNTAFTSTDANTVLQKLKTAYEFSSNLESCCHSSKPLDIQDISSLESSVNYKKMLAVGQFLVRFFSNKRMEQLERLLSQNHRQIFCRQQTKIIIGSSKDDIHIQNADLILDFSGDDSYLTREEKEGKGIIIDCKGADIYHSDIPFQFGSSFMGASLLLDFEGNDTYSAKGYSLGAGIGGIGILIDRNGDDVYIASQTSMGIGLFGIGILHDYMGCDRYVSGYLAQGLGLTGGVGILVDDMGDDRFTSEGLVPSSYEEPFMYDGFSQGVGFGLRHLARGGVGILVDHSGNDTYRSGNFSQGTGYYFGVGLLFDFSGDDRYECARYGLGASAHSASGIFMDFSGNDSYSAAVQAACGAAWDLSTALFCDKAGDDTYKSAQKFSFGAADQNGLAFHYDLGGNDRYSGGFYTTQSNAYRGGQSAGIFVNLNGNDSYPDPFSNNLSATYNELLFVDKSETNMPQ